MDGIGLIIQIIDTVISFTCIVFIYYRSKKSGVMLFETKLILLTQACFWFSCISSLFMYFLPPLNSVDGEMTALLIGSPGMLALLLGYFLYLVLVSRFSAERPGLITFFVAAVMFGGAFFLAISGALTFEYVPATDKWTMAANSFWFTFLVGAMGYYVGFYALIQLLRMFRNSMHLNRRALRTFILASLLAFIVPNLVFSLQPPPGTPGVNQTPLTTDIPFIFLGIGIAMFCYAYLINPSLGFIASHKIYRLIVVSSAGIPLYSTSFEEDMAGSYSTDELIAGALTGITHLMEESVRGHAIQGIRFQNKEIILKGEVDYYVLIVAERSSGILQSCLAEFTTQFNEKYGNHVRTFKGAVDIFAGADELLDRTFRVLGKERRTMTISSSGNKD